MGQPENSIEKLFSDGKKYYGGNIAVKPRVPPSGTNEDGGNAERKSAAFFQTYVRGECGVFSSEAATRLSH
jgi:hypothetical protein